MDNQTSPIFDTAVYEEPLAHGGVEASEAKAHRKALELALATALNGLATENGLTRMETRLELAIARQTVDLQKALTEHTNRYLAWTIALVGGMIGLATAIIKLA